MMDQKIFACWEEFEAEVEALFRRVRDTRIKKKPHHVSEPLFRGLADESWGLKTTLERYTTREFSSHDYFNVIQAVRPEIQSFTEKSWDLGKEPKDDYGPHTPQGYEFMIYLRHHGFPSP